MDNQKENTEILFKATGKGYSVSIHGRQKEDGSWECAIEENEVIVTEIPKEQHVNSLEEKREYEKTEFEYEFTEAFRKIEHSEWFLCHPGKIHPEFSDFVMNAFYSRMDEYNAEFPVESAMEEFLRNNKVKEWKEKIGSN